MPVNAMYCDGRWGEESMTRMLGFSNAHRCPQNLRQPLPEWCYVYGRRFVYLAIFFPSACHFLFFEYCARGSCSGRKRAVFLCVFGMSLNECPPSSYSQPIYSSVCQRSGRHDVLPTEGPT
ncbi:hypothetical protein TcCL_ESM11946 [Trypanosoma cruzi]|nr:hypothetical protein TcCL_ESM11946 [Trypanosoma cruzi]